MSKPPSLTHSPAPNTTGGPVDGGWSARQSLGTLHALGFVCRVLVGTELPPSGEGTESPWE